ncbi:MAG: hypothetical protein P8N58_07445, partial [Emcibacteraceae bacterium]|nr:hypothetical protein [Emcibacteraceae bacterium]
VADADDVNENFQALKSSMESLEAQLIALTQASTPAVFVGLTTELTAGNAYFSPSGNPPYYRGISAMNERCRAEYPGAKMCTAEEIISSSSDSQLEIDTSAWRKPTLIGDFRTEMYGSVGTQADGGVDCKGWSQLSMGQYGRGTVVVATETSLSFELYDCGGTRPVACCK